MNSKLAELKVNQKHSAQMKQSFLVFFWPLQLPAIGTYLHDAIFGKQYLVHHHRAAIVSDDGGREC